MKKIIAFGGSTSQTSINKQLATYAAHLFSNAEVEVLDLNDGVYDPEHEISCAIFMNKWASLNGYQICCEFCEHDFVLEKVEY